LVSFSCKALHLVVEVGYVFRVLPLPEHLVLLFGLDLGFQGGHPHTEKLGQSLLGQPNSLTLEEDADVHGPVRGFVEQEVALIDHVAPLEMRSGRACFRGWGLA
jgi:hypothetical protein